MRAHPLLSLLSLSCAVFAPASLSAAALHVLEPVSFDSFDYSLGIAADGTVVGYSDNFDTILPVSWARSGAGYGGAAALPLISGGESGEARWISPDASLIGGRVSVAAPDGDLPDYRPVVWTRTGAGTYAADALPRLGAAPADATVSAGTATGARLVGHDGADSTAALWRRTGSSYTVQALPTPGAANGPSFATAISADGTRIVGRYTVDENAQAVVWTETGPASFSHRVLQTLPGGAESFANVISLDGALAAGASDSANGLVAVKWDTATGAATALENLPGDYGTVRAISGDSYWLGGSSIDSDTFASSAVLWNHEGKIHDLVTLAAEAGAAFEGFTPESVTGIHLVSTGLYTIVGTGVSIDTGFTQGFVLENLALFAPIPEPATTPAIVGSATLAGVYMSRRRRLAAPSVPATPAGETAPVPRILGSSTRAARSAR